MLSTRRGAVLRSADHGEMRMVWGILLGMATGVVLGASTGRVGLWLPIGLMVGMLAGLLFRKRPTGEDPSDPTA